VTAYLPGVEFLAWPWNAVVFFFVLLSVSFMSSWMLDRYGWRGYAAWITGLSVVCGAVYLWT
jgi:O-antigen/teichoic acid export membrane protein